MQDCSKCAKRYVSCNPGEDFCSGFVKRLQTVHFQNDQGINLEGLLIGRKGNICLIKMYFTDNVYEVPVEKVYNGYAPNP